MNNGKLSTELPFGELNKLISSAKNILLATHHQPDPDGLGSMYALSEFIKQKQSRASVFFEGNLSNNLGIVSMAKADKFDYNDFDLIIGLDYGSIDRLCLPWPWQDSFSEKLISIDHHESAANKGILTMVDYKACATSLLIYRYLKQSLFNINNGIATALYWGIFNDSGGFSHRSVDEEVFMAAADLIRCGAASHKIVSNFLYRQKRTLDIWGRALSALRIDKGLKLAYICLHNDFFNHYQVDLRELSGLGNIILRAREVKVVLVLSEFKKGFIDGSLRVSMNWPVNAASIAEQFGGGGHRKAAGFQSRGDIKESLHKIKEALIY